MPLTFAQKLQRIPHYESGATGAEARERYQVEDAIKLSSNESPHGPVPAVLERIAAAGPELNRYPERGSGALRSALADRFELPAAHIAVGNGSCELLLAAAEALLEPDAEVITAAPSFAMYGHLAAVAGAEWVQVALDRQGRHDLDRMADAVTEATRLLVVCNPNNPTGTFHDSGTIAAFLERVPRCVCVIIDQAYVEFQLVEDPDSSLDLLGGFPNLVLTRTFSKVHGLCGLRCGYALGSAEFRQAVDSVRQPFPVNSLAQVAGTEALRHTDDVVRRVERNATERLFVEEGLTELALQTTDTQANFSWITLPEDGSAEAEVVEGLARRGVIVRAGTPLGSPGHLRVTYGTRPENERFIEALGETLA